MPGWNFIQALAFLPPISVFQRHHIPVPLAVEQCKDFIHTAYGIEAEPEMPFGKNEAIFRPSNASVGPVKFVFRISEPGSEVFRHNFYQLKGSLFIKSQHFFCYTIVDLPRAVSLHAMTKERLASESEKKPYLSTVIWPQLAEALGNSMVDT